MQDRGQDLLAGIDIGNTSIKCCIYRTDATPVASAARPTRLLRQNAAGGADPARLWTLVCEVAQEAWCTLDGRQRAAVRGLAVAGMGCTAVPVDEHGAPLFPLFWSPPGTPALFARVAAETDPRAHARITGYPLEPENTSFWLALLAERERERFSRIDAVLSVAGYINLQLTGSRSWEHSTAGSLALWDFRAGGWWADFLQLLGLPAAAMGSPRWSGGLIGPLSHTAADRMGWRPGIPIVLGGHDYPCAALAAGCVRAGSLFNIAGTFEILASFHAVPPLERDLARQRTLVDHHVVPSLYALMAEAVGAGHLEWFRRTLAPAGAPPPEWEDLLAEMAALPSPLRQPPVLFVPHLFGRWVPRRDEAAWGLFAGLSEETGRAQMLRAIVEGICFMVRQARDGMGLGDTTAAAPIRVAGGGSRNTEWLRIKASILGTPLLVPRLREATALGAALLAGIGVGVYRDAAAAAAAAALQGEDVYEPDPPLAAWYDEVYRALFLPLIDAARDLDARTVALLARSAAGTDSPSETPPLSRIV